MFELRDRFLFGSAWAVCDWGGGVSCCGGCGCGCGGSVGRGMAEQHAAGDYRAVEILNTAYSFIQERGAKLPKLERGLFLGNIPSHREIVRLWEENNDG